jgi:hypothetical protein
MSTLAAGRTRSYGGGGLAVARIIRLIAGIVAAIIVLGILLVVLEAKPSNDIVGAITDAARWLAGPFRGIFSFDSHKLEVAVNWGLAAAIYYAVAHLISRFAARA